jgi:hypothetical protein
MKHASGIPAAPNESAYALTLAASAVHVENEDAHPVATTGVETGLNVSDYARNRSLQFAAQFAPQNRKPATERLSATEDRADTNGHGRPFDNTLGKAAIERLRNTLGISLRGPGRSINDQKTHEQDGSPAFSLSSAVNAITARLWSVDQQRPAISHEIGPSNARPKSDFGSPLQSHYSNAANAVATREQLPTTSPNSKSASDHVKALRENVHKHLEPCNATNSRSFIDSPIEGPRKNDMAPTKLAGLNVVSNTLPIEQRSLQNSESFKQSAEPPESNRRLRSSVSALQSTSNTDTLEQLRTHAEQVFVDRSGIGVARLGTTDALMPMSTHDHNSSHFAASMFVQPRDLQASKLTGNAVFDTNALDDSYHIDGVLERILNISDRLIAARNDRPITIRAPRPRMRMSGYDD